MLRHYSKLIIYGLLLYSLNQLEAQDKTEYKEVLLDGKPARLNITTGEVTLLPVSEANKDSLTYAEIAIKAVDTINLRFHTVKNGETLLDISRQYDLSLQALKELNNLETTLVDEGQVLRVSSKTKNFSERVAYESKELTTETNINTFHKVQKGETLYSISKQYDLSVEQLKDINGLSSNLIKTGQSLYLIEKPQIDAVIPESIIVKKGDTLYSISKRFNTSVDNLKALNGLNNNLILIGQELRIK